MQPASNFRDNAANAFVKRRRAAGTVLMKLQLRQVFLVAARGAEAIAEVIAEATVATALTRGHHVKLLRWPCDVQVHSLSHISRAARNASAHVLALHACTD